MRLVVAGGRRFYDKARVYRLLDRIYAETPNLEIVTGLADGADTFGLEWAKERGVKYHEYPAKWRVNGVFDKGAGHKRNREMAKFGTAALIFWDGESTGSASMIKYGHQYELNVVVVDYDYNENEMLRPSWDRKLKHT
jgi:hypothetical protein